MDGADGPTPKGEPLNIQVKDATGGEVQVRGSCAPRPVCASCVRNWAPCGKQAPSGMRGQRHCITSAADAQRQRFR